MIVCLYSGKYIIQNIAAQNDGEKTKVKVKVRINNHGIFSVSTASMVEQMKMEENESSSIEAEIEPQSQKPESCNVSWSPHIENLESFSFKLAVVAFQNITIKIH